RETGEYTESNDEGTSDDIVYSNYFAGVHGSYLAASVRAAGMDPNNSAESEPSKMNLGKDTDKKAWKDIWGCGKGIGTIKKVQHTKDYVAQLDEQYQRARERLLK